jgi:hypothetical protein
VRDAVTESAGPAGPRIPAAPPPVGAPPGPAPGGRPPRRPTWLRAALYSLIVLLAGAALGGAGYSLERGRYVQTPTVQKTADGWSLTARGHRELSGLGLHGEHLIWQHGASVEYMDLGSSKVLLLGPGPGMRTTWDPAIGERYAVWFEAERPESVAAQAVAYDTQTGRRWNLGDIGSVNSYPAISRDLTVWSSSMDIGEPAVWGARIHGEWGFQIAPGYGAPVVSGGLVVWAKGWTGPFVAEEVANGASWPVAAAIGDGRLTGLALSGRELVWGQSGDSDSTGVVALADVGSGATTALAIGITGLAGPSYDGRTAVWGEKAADGGRVMARRPGAGDAFVVSETDGSVVEVAVSGDRAAWVERAGGGVWRIVVARLPR